MTKTLLALAVAVVALGGAATHAQSSESRANPRSTNRWPPGLEAQERAITRELNLEQANQPTQYYYPPQYSYVPPPQYSYAPRPTYAYPYDYPPRPWFPRY